MAKIVAAVAKRVAAGTIEVPEIVVLPDSAVSFTFRPFDLKNLDRIAYHPLADEIMVQQLRTEMTSFIAVRMSGIKQERPEDYIVADLLYKLACEVVARLRSYLADDGQVERVLLDHANRIGDFVFQQIMEHHAETETSYRVTVQPGFFGLKGPNYNQPPGAPTLDFRSPVTPKADTRKHVFQGYRKCCFLEQMFHSDDERRFSVVVDDDASVIRWAKPGRRQFMIEYRRGEGYEPDFVVETLAEKLICEVKAQNELDDPEVLAKARAARTWIGYANTHAGETGDKPWRYVLIPHDEIIGSATLAGLVAKLGQSEIHGLAG